MFVPIGPITPQAVGPEGGAPQGPDSAPSGTANFFDAPLPVGGWEGGRVGLRVGCSEAAPLGSRSPSFPVRCLPPLRRASTFCEGPAGLPARQRGRPTLRPTSIIAPCEAHLRPGAAPTHDQASPITKLQRDETQPPRPPAVGAPSCNFCSPPPPCHPATLPLCTRLPVSADALPF